MSTKSEVLKRSALFHGCTAEEVESIFQKTTTLSVKAGDPVFVINDANRFVYIVVSGAIDIVGVGNVRNQYVKLRTVHPNEQFGELSVLVGDRHQTSAFANVPTELLCILGEDYLSMVREIAVLGRNQLEILVGHYLHNIRHVFSLPMLQDISTIQYDRRFARLAPIKLPSARKAIPVRIESNIVTVACCLPLSKEVLKAVQDHYRDYQLKLTLLEDSSYETLRKSYLGFYSGQSSQSALREPAGLPMEGAANPAEDLEDLRSSTLLLSQLSIEIFQQISPHFKVQDYAEGDVIFSSEKRSDRLYFLGTGQVAISKAVPGLGVQTVFATAERYDAFFDTSLCSEKDASLTVVAQSRSRIFSLSKQIFTELLKLTSFSVHFSITVAKLIQDLNGNKSQLQLYVKSAPGLNLTSQTLLPQSMMKRSKIIPLELADKDLTIGIVLPKAEILDEAIDAYLRGFNVNMCLITEENFAEWTAPMGQHDNRDGTVTVFKNSAGDNRVLKLVPPDANLALSEILENALTSNASDIHFEPTEKSMLIRYRIDGVMTQLWNPISVGLGQSLTRIVKVQSEINIAESRLPQDGQFRFQKNGIEGFFRVSTLPTRYGEKIVLRSTGRKNAVIPLQLLAPNTKITKFFNRLTKYQQGIFFITGPTGSGKSTTLYSILNELNSPGKNIISIEDPIEANISGINQIEINTSIGLTHEKILRSVLRQDPDVIMLGEIRDEVSMQLALDAALAGQLVLTTIHAGNTLEVIPRIKELGGTASHIASGLIGVLAQRLVRRLCDCKKSRAITSHERELFSKLDASTSITHVMDAVGCASCNFSGFSGQLPIYEFWEKSMQIHNVLTDDGTSKEIVQAIRESNFESMSTYGLRIVSQGLTTFSEVNDVLFGITDLMAS
ncbi:hypothetical protein BH10BDE1_BH10BDE1_04420 [soil metagenome]